MIQDKSNNPDTLKKAEELFSSGRVPHALLIDGGSEDMRQKTARLIAKMTVCSVKSTGFCGECSSCRKADENIHPDIITVEKPEDKKNFQKSQVKEIVDGAYITPNESDKKVFIISEMQNMTEESQNVLLKILEEPPAYTSFIITADTRNSLIGTILSRVTRFVLGENPTEDYSEKALSVTKNILEAMFSQYEFDIVSASAPLDGNKALTAEVLSLLVMCFRDAAVSRYGGKCSVSSLGTLTEKLGSHFETGELLNLYDGVNALCKSLENNPNYALLSAVLCIKLRSVRV